MDTDRADAIRRLVCRAGVGEWGNQVQNLLALGIDEDEIREALPPEALSFTRLPRRGAPVAR